MGVMLSRTLRGTLLLTSLLGTLNAAPKFPDNLPNNVVRIAVE